MSIIHKIILWATIFIIAVTIGVILKPRTTISADWSYNLKITGDPRPYAFFAVGEKFGYDQWEYLNNLIIKESNWRNEAQNPKSSAFGLFQFLDSTWATVGYEKTTDPRIQIDAGLAYIEQRYGTPQKAWQHSQIHNWY